MKLVDRAVHQLLSFKVVRRHSYAPQTRQYSALTRRISEDDVVFLNYGYAPETPMQVKLSADDEPNRYPIQLYHATATQPTSPVNRFLRLGVGTAAAPPT